MNFLFKEQVIQKNDEIRLRIIGLRIDASDIVTFRSIEHYFTTLINKNLNFKYAIGTLRDDYLGLIN